jgi:hypothetical protein
MIQCNDCGFAVNETMKFALMQNICPSCGSALFSARDSSLISMIEAKLNSQKFSTSLNEELSYDISLFIFNELSHGLGKRLIDEAVSNAKSGANISEDGESEETDDVRSQIEEELSEELAQLGNDGGVIIENEELFSKAERLKKLREQQLAVNPNLGNKPVTSKRGNGFGGISRRD